MIKDILNESNLKKDIEIVGLVKSCNLLRSSTDQLYLNIDIVDKSGGLNLKKWSTSEQEFNSIKDGGIFSFKGQLTSYKNNYQLKVSSFEKVDESEINKSDFYETSRNTKESMIEELNKLISSIKDKEIRNLTKTCIEENFDKYVNYPAAVSVHHSYPHGLLTHSLSVCRNALNLADNYQYFSRLNKDYIICGSLLHDLGKTKELEVSQQTAFTIQGSLLGHISIGFSMIMEIAHKLNITEEKLNVIGNIILSHHGKLEFGSPTTCATLEALLVHYADEIDSRVEILYKPLTTAQEGKLTDKIAYTDRSNFYVPLNYESEE